MTATAAAAIIVPGRHVKDGNGVYRHMRGHRRDRRMPAGHDKLMAVSNAPMPKSLFLDGMTKVPLLDQGQEGSCVGQGYAESTTLLYVKHNIDARTAAQNAYKIVRVVEGTPLTDDSGAEVRDMHAAGRIYGVCKEELDPYSDAPESMSAPITEEQKADAASRKLTLSLSCPTIDQIKHAMLQGYAVQTGFTCFESLMSAQTAESGLVLLPEAGEDTIGGHSVTLCGWDDDMVCGGVTGVFIFRNHWNVWGAEIDGIKGYGYLPQAYYEQKLAGDNHSPRLIEGVA